MNKKLILIAILSPILLAGCATNDKNEKNSYNGEVVYDCSELTVVEQEEMTKRMRTCSLNVYSEVNDCNQLAIESVCKPTLLSPQK
jgi:uncharacterized protein YcfL